MPILQPFHVLFFVPVGNMALPAQGHKVLNLIFFTTATHTPTIYMMYVDRSVTTDFAWHIFLDSVPKVV